MSLKLSERISQRNGMSLDFILDTWLFNDHVSFFVHSPTELSSLDLVSTRWQNQTIIHIDTRRAFSSCCNIYLQSKKQPQLITFMFISIVVHRHIWQIRSDQFEGHWQTCSRLFEELESGPLFSHGRSGTKNWRESIRTRSLSDSDRKIFIETRVLISLRNDHWARSEQSAVLSSRRTGHFYWSFVLSWSSSSSSLCDLMPKVEQIKVHHKQCQDAMDWDEKRLQRNGLGVITDGQWMIFSSSVDRSLQEIRVLNRVAPAKNIYTRMISAASKPNLKHKLVEVRWWRWWSSSLYFASRC